MGTASPTNVDGVVGHHVLVVVEPVLRVGAAFLVAKKLLRTQIIAHNQMLRCCLLVLYGHVNNN